MYEFPPPVWQIQDWTVLGVLSILVFGIALPLVVAKFSKPTPSFVLAWTLFTALLAFTFMTASESQYWVLDPQRYLLLLPTMLLLISAGVTIRLWWMLPHWKELAKFAALAFGLFFIFALVLLPPDVTSRPASRRTSCKNNLKQIALAFHNYHDVHNSFPPAAVGVPEVSWRVSILPFIEESEAEKRYVRAQPWDSVVNQSLQTYRVEVYGCPARPSQFDSTGRFLTSYVAPTGAQTVFDSIQGTSFDEITDGTANTLLMLEAAGTEIIWTEPRDVDAVSHWISVNGPGTRRKQSDSMLSSWHVGGAQVAMADGSVRFISNITDPSVLKGLLTIDGDEAISDF